MAFGVSFFSFTTEVAPGAGTKVSARELPSGSFLQRVELAIGPNGDSVSTTTPLPVTVDGETGSPFFIEASDVDTTPGIDQTLITFSVAAGILRRLRQALVDCRMEGVFKVTANGATIGSGKTGPGCDGKITWNPARALPDSAVCSVIFRARAGSAVTKVSAYLQCADEA